MSPSIAPTEDPFARLEAVFTECRGQGRAALIPYVTAGYPTLDSLPDLVGAAVDGGADAVEVGVPFSDPLADGPVLQAAATEALRAGFTLDAFWPVLARAAGWGAPLLLLTYVNPVLARGEARFLEEARAAGASGLIVPDLPWVESAGLRRAARRRRLHLIPMAAPTSTAAHLAQLRGATGFVYAVSVTGVTGARDELAADLAPMVAAIRRAAALPVAVGFGISTAAQAREVGRAADAVIVGSALMRVVGDAADPAAAVRRFVAELRAALDDGALEERGRPAAR
jgi:tryptophan synthase alpha chain